MQGGEKINFFNCLKEGELCVFSLEGRIEFRPSVITDDLLFIQKKMMDANFAFEIFRESGFFEIIQNHPLSEARLEHCSDR